MRRTARLKRLLGTGDGVVGVRSSREHDVHECTVCGTRFDAGDVECPECGSRIFRTRTVVPDAALNLVVILVASGLGVVYNVLTGRIPRE